MPSPASLRRLAALFSLPLVLSFAAAGAAAQTKPSRAEVGADAGTAILWVGNSFFYYNNSMHGHYNELVRVGDPGGKNRSTVGDDQRLGPRLARPDAYLQPDGIGKYSFVPGNKIVFNPPGRQFDTVIMMDCSQCPVHPQLAAAFHATVKKDAAIIASTARARCSSCRGRTRTRRR
jgi:hypothetical protein